MPLAFPILKFEKVAVEDFIRFWGDQYHYQEESLYDDNIKKKPLDESTLVQLFQWKNGGKLSGRKSKSIQRYLDPSERIAADASREALGQFLNRPGGAIWRIYWLHIQYREIFPIYDQHVHRAMASLQGRHDIEIASRDSAKINCYLDEYIPFVKSLGSFAIRKVDRALWAYGRFLSFKYTPGT